MIDPPRLPAHPSIRASRFARAAQAALTLQCLLCGLLATGCADGPVPEMRQLNPWVREQWADDEKHGPTFHTRLAKLGELRSQASSLGPEDRERIAGELATLLKEEETAVMRVELLRTMAVYPSPNTFSALEVSLADVEPRVRIAACNALATWQTPEAMQALGNAVGSDADLDVRIAAARALENYNDPAAAKALSIALDDNDPALQKVAMQSLKTTTGKDYGNSVPAWREYLAGGDPSPPPPVSIAERLQDWRLW